MKGNIIRLNTLHLNSASMNGVREVQGSSASGGGGIVPIPPVGGYIQFADAEVERILMANRVSSDGIGITKDDAAKVTDIYTWFANSAIKRFDELQYFTGLTFLSSSTSAVNKGAFENCDDLESVVLPHTLQTIGDYTFRNCKKLNSIGDTSNIRMIRREALNYTLITQLILPSCTSLSGCGHYSAIARLVAPLLTKLDGTLLRMQKLEYLEVGVQLAEISSYTFWQMTNDLTTFVCRASTPPTLGSTNNLNFCKAIFVPDASLEAYKTATNWNTYADRIHPLSEIEGSLVFYDKLVGDGTAYIKTDLMPNSFDNYEWKTDPLRNVNKFIFGAKSTNQSALALIYSEGESYYIYGTHQQNATQILQENIDYMHRELRMYQRQSDGIWVREHYNLITGNNFVLSANENNVTEYIGTFPLLLFACNKNTSSAEAERIYKGAIYAFIVTDSRTNEVRMSLKPCTWNGEAGMWDEVGNKFYGNAAASGEFSVAND